MGGLSTIDDLTAYLRCMEDDAYRLRKKLEKPLSFEPDSLSIKNHVDLMGRYLNQINDLSQKLRMELWEASPNYKPQTTNHKP
jgi:hypothetical protein